MIRDPGIFILMNMQYDPFSIPFIIAAVLTQIILLFAFWIVVKSTRNWFKRQTMLEKIIDEIVYTATFVAMEYMYVSMLIEVYRDANPYL
jgi:hypothetical protein